MSQLLHGEEMLVRGDGLPMKFFVPALSTGVLAMSLTPADIQNIATALVAAVFVGVVNVIAARAAAQKAIAPVAAKVDVVLGHVNSEKAIDKGIITMQKQQIDLQRETIEELKKSMALLAQAKAITETSNAIAQAAIAGATTQRGAPVADVLVDSAADSLKKIDTNTATIEKNTAKTAAAIQDLKGTP